LTDDPEPAKWATELSNEGRFSNPLSSVSRTCDPFVPIPALKRRAIFTPSAIANGHDFNLF